MKYVKTQSYTVLFEPAPEGGYIAIVPALPGCMTQGETLAEAKHNIKDAICAYLAVLKKEGENIPEEIQNPISDKITIPVPV